jgi:hypothetical protein
VAGGVGVGCKEGGSRSGDFGLCLITSFWGGSFGISLVFVFGNFWAMSSFALARLSRNASCLAFVWSGAVHACDSCDRCLASACSCTYLPTRERGVLDIHCTESPLASRTSNLFPHTTDLNNPSNSFNPSPPTRSIITSNFLGKRTRSSLSIDLSG